MIDATNLRARLSWMAANMDAQELSVLHAVALELAPHAAAGLSPLPKPEPTPILVGPELLREEALA